MRLLVVEDDRRLAADLAARLDRAGFAVDVAHDGVDGEHLGREEPYEAVVLDLGLPGRSGLDVLRGWRAAGLEVPVLILTARDAWHEKVTGFQAGADDYLAKPFHFEELLERLRALLRRRYGKATPVLEAGGLRLDEARQCVLDADGTEHSLTGTEFRLLRFFMLNPGRLLSKTRLVEAVYEQDADRDSNVIEVYVNRLRRKLGAAQIHTRRGQGYVFGAAP